MFDKLKGLRAALTSKKAKELIGEGAFGKVYSDTPGTVIKQIEEEIPQKILNEINLQVKAAELNIAPTVKEAQINFTGNLSGSGSISMQDLRKNYVQLGEPQGALPSLENQNAAIKTSHYVVYNPSLSQNQITQAEIDTHKQLAQLALNGIMLSDRHAGNIFVNKMSNRPMQIDFGLASKLETPSQQAGALAYHVGNGLKAAGLTQEASIFSQLVNEVGVFDIETATYKNPTAALDMAKQGLSRLQKIKQPQVEQIAAVRQKELEATKKMAQENYVTPTVIMQRLNTWGEPIEKGYYGTPV